MDELQQQFLLKREKLTQQWRWVGALLIGWSTLLYAYLFFFTPLLANPFHVMQRLEQGELDKTTTELMAMLLPIVTTTLFLMLLVFLVLGYAIFANEKKYQQIIRRNT